MPYRTPEYRAWYKDYRRRIKLEVLTHHSGGKPPRCARCSFSDVRALQLDHIVAVRDRGRARSKYSGTYIYQWAKAHDFPPVFQVLCANCNTVKAVEETEHPSLDAPSWRNTPQVRALVASGLTTAARRGR